MNEEHEQRLQKRYQHLEAQHHQLQQKRIQARRRGWIVILFVVLLSAFLVLYYPKPLIEGLQWWDRYEYSNTTDDDEKETSRSC